MKFERPMKSKAQIKLYAEGVLVIASSKALMSKYSENEFDYNFPGGLAELLKEHQIIALTTNEGDSVNLSVSFNTELNHSNFDNVISQYLSIKSDDELLILNHAEFTMICDDKGNYKDYSSPIQFSKSIPEGFYKINIGIKNTGDEYEKYQAYYIVELNIVSSEITSEPNQILDLEN